MKSWNGEDGLKLKRHGGAGSLKKSGEQEGEATTVEEGIGRPLWFVIVFCGSIVRILVDISHMVICSLHFRHLMGSRQM